MDELSSNLGSELVSENFFMDDDPEIKWCLVLIKNAFKNQRHLSGCSRCETINFSLYLRNAVANKHSLSITVSFSILGADSTKVLTKTKSISGLFVKSEIYGFEIFFRDQELKEFQIKHDLNLICEIRHSYNLNLSNPRLLSSGLKFYINNESFHDVTLYVGETKIHAHKVILASKSPKFNEMFSSEMEEFKTNELKVENVSIEVLMELIRYMYTGRVEKLDELGPEIFQAAHFYQIEDLKYISENVLLNHLSVDNAITNLILADDYKAQHLKEKATAFILNNFKAVMKSTQLKDLIKSHPHLPFELMMEIGSQRCG